MTFAVPRPATADSELHRMRLDYSRTRLLSLGFFWMTRLSHEQMLALVALKFVQTFML